MPDLRRRSLRLAVGSAVVIVAIVEVQTLVQTLRAGARFRARVVRSVQDAVQAERPRLGSILRPGGPETLIQAAEEALRSSSASEAELFDASGTLLMARPAASPVRHWLGPEDLRRALAGEAVTLGPLAGDDPRLLTYASIPAGDRTVLLRLSTEVPDLVEDLGERRQLLLGHALALGVLLLAGALALFPGGPEQPASTPSALDAYETAMERLRDQGLELSQQHEAERRRLADQIRDKEALARAGELTAGIVHELRNGLGTIVGYARMAERSESPEARDAARGIREECETLESVIQRFMEFVKRETLHLASFDLGRMLSRVVARESRGRPGGEVSLPSGEAATLVGDEELLERAFENLVRNAREAAGPGGHVWIAVSREGERVAVSIADDGPGLSPQVRQELRPFFTTKPGGLGLGLPIALKIVELHQGELALGDRTPRGLRINVRLPETGPSV